METPVYYVMLIILHVFLASGLLAVWLLCMGLLLLIKSTLEKHSGLKMLIRMQRCVLVGFLPLSFLMLLTGFVLLDIHQGSFSVDWIMGSLLTFVLMWLCTGVTFFLSMQAQVLLEAGRVPASMCRVTRLIACMQTTWIGVGVLFIAMIFIMVGQ